MFQLLELPFQALAVQRLLAGKPPEDKIRWLAAHGAVTAEEKRTAGEAQACRFVFFGDHSAHVIEDDVAG